MMPYSLLLSAYFLGFLMACGAMVSFFAGVATRWLLHGPRTTLGGTLAVDATLGAVGVLTAFVLVLTVPVPRHTVVTESNGTVMTSTMNRYQGPLLPVFVIVSIVLPVGFEVWRYRKAKQ
jgi:hypothetical protein